MKISFLLPWFLLVLLLTPTYSIAEQEEDDDEPDETELEEIDEDFEYGDDEDPEDKYHTDPDRQTAFPYNFVLMEDYSDDFIQVERSKDFLVEVPVWSPPGTNFETQEEAEEAFQEFISDYASAAANPENRRGWYLIYPQKYKTNFVVEELGFMTKRQRNPELTENDVIDELEGDFIWEITVNQVGLYDLMFVYCYKNELSGLQEEFEENGDVEKVRYRKVTVHVVVDEEERYFEFIDDDTEGADDVEDEGFEEGDKPSEEDTGDEEEAEEEEEEELYRYRQGDVNELLDEEEKLWEKNLKDISQEEDEEEEEVNIPEDDSEDEEEEGEDLVEDENTEGEEKEDKTTEAKDDGAQENETEESSEVSGENEETSSEETKEDL